MTFGVANTHRAISINNVPGSAIALMRDGKLKWSRGFGVTDVTLRCFQNRTIFLRCLSLAKQVNQRGRKKIIQAVRLMFMFIRVLTYAFIVAWIGFILWLFGTVLHQMLSRGQPLVINGVLRTWFESAGFIILILGLGFSGVAWLVWGLRAFQKHLDRLDRSSS